MSNISGIPGFNSVNATNAAATVATSPLLQQSGPFSNLNLTPSQQNQIKQILQSAQSQGLSLSQVQSKINAVLTPAQQSQLQQDLQGRHHHHHHGGGSSSVGSDGTDAFGIPSSVSTGSSAATQSISDLAGAFSLQAQLQNNNNE